MLYNKKNVSLWKIANIVWTTKGKDHDQEQFSTKVSKFGSHLDYQH